MEADDRRRSGDDDAGDENKPHHLNPNLTPILVQNQRHHPKRNLSTWASRWLRAFSLPAPSLDEYLISVDHKRIWRRHLAWSRRDGAALRDHLTQRFASNMVFMSLLLGAALGVLFSPSKPADAFRAALREGEYNKLDYWAGLTLCLSIGFSISTLVATFTAWAIISSVGQNNAKAVLRSSIGIYATQLPARLVVLSVYTFLAWVTMLVRILFPRPTWLSVIVAALPAIIVVHAVIVYSSLGRMVLYSRAMGNEPVFDVAEEMSMDPEGLFEALLHRAQDEKSRGTALPLFYRTPEEITECASRDGVIGGIALDVDDGARQGRTDGDLPQSPSIRRRDVKHGGP